MNNEQRTIRGFTLIELVVAVAILAIVLSFAGVIFRVSIDSYRTAIANAEIMQKLRAITDQLNADFKGLRKDGEIFVIWEACLKNGFPSGNPNSYERFDRIMFFADGDFQSYHTYGTNPKVIRGNLARISYMLAKNKAHELAEAQTREKRILARTQHIFTADSSLPYAGPDTFTTDLQWYNWHNVLEYDKMTMEEWKNIPLEMQEKQNMLSVITDIAITVGVPSVSEAVWGAHADPADPNTIHILLCEGVGEFKVQGWSYDPQQKRWRWVPEVDPDGHGDLTNSDFFIGMRQIPGVLYPFPPSGMVSINGAFYGNYFQELLNEANFDSIPGLGRALKFTFTLYDSKGVIKNGRTFTHIVYLD